MPADTSASRIRGHLERFDLTGLFIEELGWDRHQATDQFTVDGLTCAITAIAQKRGMVAFEACPVDGEPIPDYATRRKIEREVAKIAHEHLLVYTDPAETMQVWQWVKREPGRPAVCREQTFYRGHSADSLVQRLQVLAVALQDEENLTLFEVTGRVRQAFDVDQVTRKFYDEFKVEHAAFLKHIKGIKDTPDREWYASLMLNRLMFIYFIQRKRFLDDDPDYLRTRLHMMQERKKKDQFLTFYRHFLLRLFHEGLGQEGRSSELDELLGRVPYLNGGLFDVHELEEANPDIQIPDSAFVRLFDFFSEWHWHLDERPTRAQNEINPDVLGYIFERYINDQAKMGAYYTKEDITGYIARNTIIPFLFGAAEKACAVAFRPESAVWRLLRDDPDRYIYDAVRHGVDEALPEEVEAGIGDVARRETWNRAADERFALPTETWREHVTRRQRCQDIRAKLAAGEVQAIDDLVTLNLDICQFAQDVIENCEGPELLRAFYKAIEQVTVLDPTCGSGAFLFAALNILEPLYEACLTRMEAFVGDLDRSGEKHHPEKFSDFRRVLKRVADHLSHRHFVLKSIIVENLFGVDIMEEAVEICKLRLFLKLAAQVERFEDLEPLPDIDFNIRPGNTLVGFADWKAVKASLHARLDFEDDLPRITESAELADRAFRRFREMQTEQGMSAADFHEAKADVRDRLDALRDELDQLIAADYGVNPAVEARYCKWRDSHEPFHWCVEFYGTMHVGGFDVIIGNPPYVEYPRSCDHYSIRGYASEPSANLYAFVMERSFALLRSRGWFGMIVPVGAISLDKTATLRQFMNSVTGENWVSSYGIRPAKLFEGVDQRLTIHIARQGQGQDARVYATRYMHWHAEERTALFSRLAYAEVTGLSLLGRIAKAGDLTAVSLVRRMANTAPPCEYYLARRSGSLLHYHRSPRYWIRSMDFEPYFKSPTRSRSVHHFRDLWFRDEQMAKFVGAVLNSSAYFVWYICFGNCRNIAGTDIKSLPVGAPTAASLRAAAKLLRGLMADYERHSVITVRQDCEYQEFDPSQSKPVMDKIDCLLGEHYGFTDLELDYIINYDIKYRMGGAEEAEEEDDE